MEHQLNKIEGIFNGHGDAPERAFRICQGNLQHGLIEGDLTSEDAGFLADHIWGLFVEAKAKLGQPPFQIAEWVDDTHTTAVREQKSSAWYEFQLIDSKAARLLSWGTAFDVSVSGDFLRYWVDIQRDKVVRLVPENFYVRTARRPLKSFHVQREDGLVMSFQRAGFIDGPMEAAIEAMQATERPDHPKRVFLGCLLGLAVGDALGAAVENLDAQAIAGHFPQGLSDFQTGVRGSLLAGLPAGTYTDDTVMALGLAEAYIAERGSYHAASVAASWVRWKQNGPYAELGPGVACDQAIGRLMRGVSPEDAGVEGSAGNGGAMRVAPVGLLHYDDPQRCVQEAIAQSRITHRHPEADAAAACMATAIAFLVRHHRRPFAPETLWELLQFEARRHSEAFAAALHRARAAEQPVRNVSGYVTETLPAAFRLFLSHRDSYEAAVCAAANSGGDTDTLAALVGAMAGAFLGAEAIPDRWRIRLRDRERVEAAALALAEFARVPSEPYEPRWGSSTEEELNRAWQALDEQQRQQREVGYRLPDGVKEVMAAHPDPRAMWLVHQAEFLIHSGASLQGLHHYEWLGERLFARADQPWRALLGPMLERRGYAWYKQGACAEAAWCLRLAYQYFAVEHVPPGHWMAYAGILADAGQWAEALLLLQGLLSDVATSSSEEAAWLRAAIYVTMGNVLDTADDLDGAMACYRACIEVAEDDAEEPDTQHIQMALTNMGVAHHRRERWREAVAFFDQALEFGPDEHVEGLRTSALQHVDANSLSEPGFRRLVTVDRQRPFQVKGSIEEGVTFRFAVGGATFSAEDWRALLKHFASRHEVSLGASRTMPPAGSLGAYLMDTKKQNLASYLLPLLVEAGLAKASKKGRGIVITFAALEH